MFRYRYKISTDSYDFGVFPLSDATTSKQTELYGDEVFYRDSIKGDFTFIGEAANFIRDQDIETRFQIEAEKLDATTNSYTADWIGEFWKTDCKIDNDKNNVVVKISILDQYNLVLNGLNKEFNLINLSAPTRTVQFEVTPILQLYKFGDSLITNFNNTTYWEQECEQVTDFNVIQDDYFFTQKLEYIYIPGDLADTISPDVTGYYYRVNAFLYSHETLPYDITIPSGDYELSDLSGVLFSGPSNGTGWATNEPAATLTSTTTSQQVELYYVRIFSRMLMPTNYLSACDVRPESDIIPYSENYPFIYDVDLGLAPFVINDEITSTPNRYGRRDFPRLNVATAQEYYVKPTALPINYFPILRSSWRAYATWFYFDGDVTTAQTDGTLTTTIKDAYLLWDVIKYLLLELDPAVTFPFNETYSQFYFSEENPLDASRNYYLLIPKSNLLVGDYDQPAQVVNVKLADLLGDLWRIHRVKWHLNTDKEFYAEHIRYYRNGGHYVTPQIGLDISAYVDARTNKPWGFDRNKYSYEKQKLPGQIVSKMMDKASYPFEGYPIEINSRYVEESLISEERMLTISTDIDYSLLNVSEIGTNGFFMVACSLASSVYTVKFKDVVVNGETFSLQNGWLSFIYLHPNFFKDDAPAGDVNINEADTTALSTKRIKVQDEIEFAAAFSPDPMQLITTLLGTGKIKSINETFDTGAKKVIVYHDTE